MSMEESMDIVEALRHEELKLEKQLKGIQGAIVALNGSFSTSSFSSNSSGKSGRPRGTISAAGRAAISRSMKARWARFHAGKAKKAK
jgi:hypothetical protein